MDRVHDYESCDIGSIPKYGCLFLERWQSLDYCTSLENWQPSVMAVRGFKSHPLRFYSYNQFGDWLACNIIGTLFNLGV